MLLLIKLKKKRFIYKIYNFFFNFIKIYLINFYIYFLLKRHYKFNSFLNFKNFFFNFFFFNFKKINFNTRFNANKKNYFYFYSSEFFYLQRYPSINELKSLFNNENLQNFYEKFYYIDLAGWVGGNEDINWTNDKDKIITDELKSILKLFLKKYSFFKENKFKKINTLNNFFKINKNKQLLKWNSLFSFNKLILYIFININLFKYYFKFFNTNNFLKNFFIKKKKLYFCSYKKKKNNIFLTIFNNFGEVTFTYSIKKCKTKTVKIKKKNKSIFFFILPYFLNELKKLNIKKIFIFYFFNKVNFFFKNKIKKLFFKNKIKIINFKNFILKAHSEKMKIKKQKRR